MTSEDQIKIYNSYKSLRERNYSKDYLRSYLCNAKSIIQKTDIKYEQKIIDLGCGNGGTIFCLNLLGYNNTNGVDISSEEVKSGTDLGVKNLVIDDINNYVKNLEDNSVNLFILSDVIEHLTLNDTTNLLIACRDKLKRSGKIYLHIPNASSYLGSHIKYSDLTHTTSFTVNSMLQLKNLCGFSYLAIHEDKIEINSIKGLVRRIVWEILVLPTRIKYYMESGVRKIPMSLNFAAIISK
ncbi:class I SAM-dependent methyltransferase [Verrucomicrobiales bacterium]|nr:class I SAM-dependent methyltransferase [Verrucomicrobiales bacterium]